MTEPALQLFFQRLDQWRHLPAYRLEPRVDALLSLYLRGVLQERTGRALAETVLPELPLRLGTLWGEETRGPNQSVKVDFALFTEDRSAVYLVEVKTDLGSRREAQDVYLERAAALDFWEIVDGILQISLATSSANIQKYVHLLAALERLGFVRCPPELRAYAYPRVRRGVRQALRAVENLVAPGRTRIEVFYLQPEPGEEHNAIGFDALAAYARRQEDGIGPLLAGYLERWQEPAGAVDPWGQGRAGGICLSTTSWSLGAVQILRYARDDKLGGEAGSLYRGGTSVRGLRAGTGWTRRTKTSATSAPRPYGVHRRGHVRCARSTIDQPLQPTGTRQIDSRRIASSL